MRKNFEDCFANIKIEPGVSIATPPHNLMLGFGLTSKCNFNCPICFYHNNSTSKKNTELSPRIIENILKSLGKLYLVNLSLLGEPFLHSRILNILEMAGRHAEHIVLCTNGSICSDNLCNVLRKLKGLKIILSLDAGDATTYSFMRKGGNFVNFLKNAIKFREYLGARIELTCVLCNNNLESLKKVPELSAALGIKNITFNLLRETSFTKSNGITSISNTDLYTFVKETEELSRNLGLKITYPTITRHICRLPFFYTSILSDGTLFPCCGDFKPEKIKSFDYEGIFNHAYLTSIRSNLQINNPDVDCIDI